MTTNNAINMGYIQGIVLKEVYSPKDNVAIVTLKVKDPKVNPSTGKRSVYTIQFSAFNENAHLLRTCTKGQLIFLCYYLTTHKRIDTNGVTSFFKIRTITKIQIGENISGQTKNVPYINHGILQGDIVSIKNAPNADNVAFVTLRIDGSTDNETRMTYQQVTVYGKNMIASINKYYHLGDSLCVNFKIETSSREKDGEKEYYLDYVVTDIL